jgi:hypothetical protein
LTAGGARDTTRRIDADTRTVQGPELGTDQFATLNLSRQQQ